MAFAMRLIRTLPLASLLLLFSGCPGPRPDSGSDGGSDASMGTTRAGLINVAQVAAPTGTSGFVGGFFGAFNLEAARQGEIPGFCTRTMAMGDCARLSCSGTVRFDEAGTLTVRAAGTEIASVMGGAMGYFHAVPMALFAAGDEIVVAGSGGASVPAFSVSTTALAPPTATFPATITAGANLVVPFTAPTGATRVQLGIGMGGGGGMTQVVCTVPPSSGTVTVPGALLADLASGAMASFSLAAGASATTIAGDYSIEVVVLQTASASARVE